ncbi:universal stress protein [Serratia marcescens]|nr:universal stress protein [Serratia marcescens]
MSLYQNALLLVQDERDGRLLLRHAERLNQQMNTRITVAHISADYAELDYLSDAQTKDRQSSEVIAAKAMLSRLVEDCTIPLEVRAIVSIHRFKDIEALIAREGVDLLLLGHQNRPFGVFASFGFEFINHLSIDVLIKHVPTP